MTATVTTPLGPVKTTTLYAAVVAKGNPTTNSPVVLRHGVGALSVTKVSGITGRYEVKFNVDVSLGCFIATVCSSKASSAFQVAVGQGTSNDTVEVRIFNGKANPYNLSSKFDDGFFLSVTTAYAEKPMTSAIRFRLSGMRQAAAQGQVPSPGVAELEKARFTVGESEQC